MLSWAPTFLVIVLIAGVLGFGGMMGTASYIAQVLFFAFLVLFVIGLGDGSSRTSPLKKGWVQGLGWQPVDAELVGDGSRQVDATRPSSATIIPSMMCASS